MEIKSRSEVRPSHADMPEVRLDGAKAPPANRWLALAVAVLSLAVIALGAALVVEAGSRDAAPARASAIPSPAAEPTATESVAIEAVSGWGMADEGSIAHVDGSIAAYNEGASDGRIRMAGHGWTSMGGPLHRYDEAERKMVSVAGVHDAVGARHVERIGPVVQVAGTPGGEPLGIENGSYTVLFSVRAGDDEQIWIQRWEGVWGEMLTEMWVI